MQPPTLTPTARPQRRLHVLIVAALVATCGCRASRDLADPTVLVQTSGGAELGVSTEYGVIFLGRTGRAGNAELTSWFGDGPSIEPALIEPVGGGLYALETEIRLPVVQLSFADPPAGTSVLVRGREATGVWSASARIARDARVDGLLLEPFGRFIGPTDQTGAGVYLSNDEGEPRLLGLISGRVELSGLEGKQTYLTMVGPTELWRLVSYRRDLHLSKPPAIRPDVL